MTDIVGNPETDYQRVQNSEEFQALKRRFRRFVFPMTAFFLAWYFLYVLLAAYAHDFMSTKVFGNINIAIIFGLRATMPNVPGILVAVVVTMVLSAVLGLAALGIGDTAYLSPHLHHPRQALDQGLPMSLDQLEKRVIA